MTLAAFRPTDADAATYAAVTQWLRDIQIAQVVTSDRLSPPAALYLHGPRGRGKTHLAIALALDLYGRGRRVAILNERAYWHKLRGVAFGPEYEQLDAEPGERAWFTVFDDLGRSSRAPSPTGATCRTPGAPCSTAATTAGAGASSRASTRSRTWRTGR